MRYLPGYSIPLLLVCLLCTLSTLVASGQIKFEKEFRIKEESIPRDALGFIEGIKFSGKVKWFREESQRGVSFEAKAKIGGQLHSIEFDSLGSLEDVEIRIDFDDIPRSTANRIASILNSNYSKVKYQEVQKQWTGDPVLIKEMLLAGTINTKVILRYEIVVDVVEDRIPKLFEYLFSVDGEVIRKDRIIPRNTDNMDF